MDEIIFEGAYIIFLTHLYFNKTTYHLGFKLEELPKALFLDSNFYSLALSDQFEFSTQEAKNIIIIAAEISKKCNLLIGSGCWYVLISKKKDLFKVRDDCLSKNTLDSQNFHHGVQDIFKYATKAQFSH